MERDRAVVLGTYNYGYRPSTAEMLLSDEERENHLYIIGKSKTGKTTLIREMLRQDIAAGKGCGLIDPHGDIAASLLDQIPKRRVDDVVYLDPTLEKYRAVINPFYRPPENESARALVGYNIVSVFKHIFHEQWSDTRLQYILTNVCLALLDAPAHLRPTLASIPLMLLDERYRKEVVTHVRNERVRSYFTGEMEKWNDQYLSEAIGPVQNRIGQFLIHPVLRHTFGAYKPTLNFREIIDEGKILIVRAPSGIFGEEPTKYFTSFVMGEIQTAAMGRASLRETERQAFYLYADEFQTVGTDATAQIFSEARKFGLYLTVANQFVNQLKEAVRAAIFGNVGSLIAFRVGGPDAEVLAKEISGMSHNQFINLGRGEVLARLYKTDDERGSWLLTTDFATNPPSSHSFGQGEKIKRYCRRRYYIRTEKVNQRITEWLQRFGDVEQDAS